MRKRRTRWDQNARRRQTETPYLMILFKSIVLEFQIQLSARDIRIECLILGSVDVGHKTPCSCFRDITYGYLLTLADPSLRSHSHFFWIRTDSKPDRNQISPSRLLRLML